MHTKDLRYKLEWEDCGHDDDFYTLKAQHQSIKVKGSIYFIC